MDIFLRILFFLPISKALKSLREIELYGTLGGSVSISCPLENLPQRYYLCQETNHRQCSTVVSNRAYVSRNYEGRVSLKLVPKEKVFLVELRKLKEEDNGIYACGMGRNTDKGKTQKVILTVTADYSPFWYKPDLLTWLSVPNEAPSSLPTTQATSTSAPRTQPPQTQQPLRPSPTSPILPQRTTLAAAAPTQTSLSSEVSKTLHLRRLFRPSSTVSYSHHTWLRGESASYFGLSMKKDGGFHILIPATLGILFIILLGMVLGRSLQKRRAFSKRMNRLSMRMSALEASQRANFHLHRSNQRHLQRPVSNRLRSQQNIYSACPRKVQRPNQNGEQMSARDTEITEPSAPPQVSMIAQPLAPIPVKNEYTSTYHLCLAEPEDSDSHDYINVSCLTQPPNSPSGLGFHANKACR